ncbi:MaoC/PaaZ C-terminal domain-containing protein [Paenisporosarcina sp. TG-14]|uniref:MaoC/PaaZ C-terminal domain-containing protein n=1 Tax=Paenisporosarcina sp. TG-14 TaxID=1231057 RepID=UPI0002F167E1|nr:MaoC/PaaZ C-terminal domain-containing protein [Paenisporosarcina sp. TG-14]
MTTFKKVYEKTAVPELIKSPITRVQLAQYAGASGDFNPIHIDEEFAGISPLGGVIAHGMLSMGFLGQFAEKIAGNLGDVKTLKVQFRAIVRPGDTISCEAEQKELMNNEVQFNITAKNQNGDIVVKGETRIEQK